MGLKWFVFLIKPLDLIGTWFGEDQRANFMKRHVQREIGPCFQMLITIVHLISNTTGRTYV